MSGRSTRWQETRLDAARKGEVPLAEQLGLLAQLERRSPYVTLVEELGLVEAAEPRHAQLALRVVRQERPAEQHHGCAQDGLDADVERRLESLARGGDVVQRLLAHLLADDLAARLRADDHAPALAVRERAERLHGFTQLARRALQFEGRGLALGHELREIDCHAEPVESRCVTRFSTSTSARLPEFLGVHAVAFSGGGGSACSPLARRLRFMRRCTHSQYDSMSR